MKHPSTAGSFWQDAAARRRLRRGVCLAILVLLVPAFVVAVFARPSADDFIYPRYTHAVVQQSGADCPEILRAALEADGNFYNTWQGLYVSGFLLALQPAIFGGQWYGLTFLFVAAMLFLSSLALARAVVHRLAPDAKGLSLFCALVLTFAWIEGMPNQV